MNSVELPGGAPARDSDPTDLLAWANLAMERRHNPIAVVRRYGFDLEARLVLVMANGEEVRVRQRDLMGSNGLKHVMLGYDGTVLPGYSQHDRDQIVARIIWASKASVRNDAIEMLVDDVATFIDRALDAGVVIGDYRVDGYRLVSDFQTRNRRSGFGVLALDSGAELWIPRRHLVDYLRDRRPKAHVPDIRSDLDELGIEWRDYQRRQPNGTRKPIARVWTVRIEWEHFPFDLAAAVAQARRQGPVREESQPNQSSSCPRVSPYEVTRTKGPGPFVRVEDEDGRGRDGLSGSREDREK